MKRLDRLIASKNEAIKNSCRPSQRESLEARERQLQRRENAVAHSRATIEAENERVNRSKKEVVELSRNGFEALKAFGSRCETLLELCKTRKLSELIPVDTVSLDPLEFPVVDENGHSFELPSLLHWLERKKSSPVTNDPYQNPDFHPQNYALRELIGKFEQLDEENQKLAATLEEEIKHFNSMLKGLTKEMVQVDQPLKKLRGEEILENMPEIGNTLKKSLEESA
ncbi:MAG: hypothetical protein LLG04_02715 [Parachlamydia sp.]|nr:hypothetical protein [Parachlamydia sp.]